MRVEPGMVMFVLLFVVRRLAEETGVRLGVLDPYGVGIEPGPDLYFALMRSNAEAVAHCLSGG